MGGVNVGDAELLAVAFLAAAELGRGERVGPTIVVPVIDVLFQGDDLNAGNGWNWSSLARRASASRQLEQPSEVNSSTSTGFTTGACWATPAMAIDKITIPVRFMAAAAGGNAFTSLPQAMATASFASATGVLNRFGEIGSRQPLPGGRGSVSDCKHAVSVTEPRPSGSGCRA